VRVAVTEREGVAELDRLLLGDLEAEGEVDEAGVIEAGADINGVRLLEEVGEALSVPVALGELEPVCVAAVEALGVSDWLAEVEGEGTSAAARAARRRTALGEVEGELESEAVTEEDSDSGSRKLPEGEGVTLAVAVPVAEMVPLALGELVAVRDSLVELLGVAEGSSDADGEAEVEGETLSAAEAEELALAVAEAVAEGVGSSEAAALALAVGAALPEGEAELEKG